MSKYSKRTIYYLVNHLSGNRVTRFWFDNYTAGEGIKDLFDDGYLVNTYTDGFGNKSFETISGSRLTLIEEQIYKLKKA